MGITGFSIFHGLFAIAKTLKYLHFESINIASKHIKNEFQSKFF